MPPIALNIFSPLPPERNGIADYTFHLLDALSLFFECTVFCTDPFGESPRGISVLDHLQAFRHLSRKSAILHQIGNNPGHRFVLDALHAWGGVTTVHDQSLHYLYETTGEKLQVLFKLMRLTSEKAGSIFANHWRNDNIKTAANYAMFDMLGNVLNTSSAVIVHSEFAKRRITRIYGPSYAERVSVIPHLAIPFEVKPNFHLSGCELSSERVVIVTAGFATAAKRFDWLVAALDEVETAGIEFTWIHAGEERPDEFNLTGLVQEYPRVRARFQITGFLSEADLNGILAACDIVVNLRFPSVGESSGSLSRAMNAGRCCVVSDTAAYAELPRNCVAHVPINNCELHLSATLKGLASNANRRLAIGAAAREWASKAWAPSAVASAYAEVIRDQTPRSRAENPFRKSGRQVVQASLEKWLTPEALTKEIASRVGELELRLEVSDARRLAELSASGPAILHDLLPPNYEIQTVRVEKSDVARQVDAGDSFYLVIKGVVY